MRTAHHHTGASPAGDGTGDGAGRTAPHNLEADLGEAEIGTIVVNGHSPVRLKFARVRSRRQPPPCDPVEQYLRLTGREMVVEAAARWRAEEAGKEYRAPPIANGPPIYAVIPKVDRDRRRDPERDARFASALRIRIYHLKAERRAKAALWLRRERTDRRRQVKILGEMDDLSGQLSRFRSLAHQLEFQPDAAESEMEAVA
jgi:hypothetical protein